jgi:hypothetical protein
MARLSRAVSHVSEYPEHLKCLAIKNSDMFVGTIRNIHLHVLLVGIRRERTTVGRASARYSLATNISSTCVTSGWNTRILLCAFRRKHAEAAL